jgi:hypothetical protein
MFDAEDLSSFGLCEVTSLDEPVNLQRELCFQKLLFWMGRHVSSAQRAES